MNYKRIRRTLICLILVCVLLVNVSPIRTEASALAVGTVLVKALPVITAAAIGLGVVGITDEMVYRLNNNLSGQNLIDKDGYIEAYHFGDGFFGLAESALELIRGSIFDEGLVYETNKHASYTSVTLTKADGTQVAYRANNEFVLVYLAFTYPNSGNATYPYRYVGRTIGFSPHTSQAIKYTTAYGESSSYSVQKEGHYVWLDFGQSSTAVKGPRDFYKAPTGIDVVHLGYFDTSAEGESAMYAYDPFGKTQVATDYDIALGYISTSESFSQGYLPWAQKSVEVGSAYYAPIGTTAIAGTAAPTYTQEDVWTGLTPIIIIDESVIGGGDSTQPTEPDTGEGQFYPMDPNYTTLIERLFGGVTEKIDQFTYSIEEIPGLLREFMLDVKTGLERLPGQFKEWFDDIRTKLQQLVTGQITLADLLSGLVIPIRDAVVDALSYLFAPSETFMQSKVEALIAKYPTAATFSELGHSFRGFFDGLGEQPPIIYIDLGASEGDYVYGGRMAFIDLTWYARYKPTVDTILGAFIWLWVAWRFFVSIPGIISGAPGIFGSPNEKPDIEIHAPRFEVGKNWLNSGSSYHKKGDGGRV